MFDFFKLEGVVGLESKYLDVNILNHLQNEVKKQFIGKCYETYGYVVDVDNVKILGAEISKADSTNRFKVSYTAKTILPRVGNIYKTSTLGKVVTIDNFRRILLNLHESKNACVNGHIQIFITNDFNIQCDLLTFNECDCVFNCKTLPIECVIDVVVDSFKYTRNNLHQFIITGRHVH
jgi:hypothetical protein